MKKKIKALVSALTAAAILACSSVPTYADKVKTVGGLLYRYSDSGESEADFACGFRLGALIALEVMTTE